MVGRDVFGGPAWKWGVAIALDQQILLDVKFPDKLGVKLEEAAIFLL